MRNVIANNNIEMYNNIWDYLRRGQAGSYVLDDETGKEVERVTDYIDTLNFKCACYQYIIHSSNIHTNGRIFIGYKYGRDAVNWIMGR